MSNRTNILSWVMSSLLALYVLTVPWPYVSVIWRIAHEDYYYVFTSLIFHWADLLALLLLVCGIFAWRWPFQSATRPQMIMLGLLGALLVLTALSTTVAQDPLVSWIFTGHVLLLFGLVLLLRHIPLPSYVIPAVFGLLLLFQGGVTLAQVVTQDDVGLQLIGEFDLAPEPGYSVVFGAEQTWLRGYGVSPHPNILGSILAAGLVAFFPALWRVEKPQWYGLALLILAVAFAGLLVTFSRSAWLGFAVGLVTLFALQWRQLFQWRTVTAGGVLAVVGLIFLVTAAPVLFARFTPAEGQEVTQSIGERELLIDLAWRTIDENGVLGMGAGNFSLRLLDWRSDMVIPVIHPVHHIPLLLTAELGWLGGFLWLGLMVFPVGYGAYEAWHGRLSPWFAAYTAALVVMCMSDLYDHFSWNWASGRMWRWLLFAVWIREAAVGYKSPNSASSSAS